MTGKFPSENYCLGIFYMYHYMHIFIMKGQNQSGGTGGRGDGKKDDKVTHISMHYYLSFS